MGQQREMWVGVLTERKQARCFCGRAAAIGYGRSERFPFSSVQLWRFDWLCVDHGEEAVKRAQALRQAEQRGDG